MKRIMGVAVLLATALASTAGEPVAAAEKAAKEVQAGACKALLEVAQPAGGMEALARAIQYPPEAKRDGLEGEVRLQVTIDAAGGVGPVTVLQPVRADLDSAAVRAIRAIPWKAARGSEGQLPCTVVVPIKFRLEQKPKP